MRHMMLIYLQYCGKHIIQHQKKTDPYDKCFMIMIKSHKILGIIKCHIKCYKTRPASYGTDDATSQPMGAHWAQHLPADRRSHWRLLGRSQGRSLDELNNMCTHTCIHIYIYIKILLLLLLLLLSSLLLSLFNINDYIFNCLSILSIYLCIFLFIYVAIYLSQYY